MKDKVQVIMLLEHAQSVTIPQPGGQESLNVAIAGSICF